MPAVPIIFLEVLSEAWYYVRMAMTAQRYYKQVDATVSAIEAIIDPHELHHRVVAGEQVFLYILGKRLGKIVQPQAYHLMDEAIFRAISNYLNQRTSDDTDSVISEFIYELGYEMEDSFGGTIDKLEAFFSKEGTDFIITDPLYKAIMDDSMDDLRPADGVLTALGLYPSEWNNTVELLRSGHIGAKWADSLKGRTIKGRVTLYSSVLGILYMGAQAAVSGTDDTVTVFCGADAFGFSAPGVYMGRTLTKPRESMPLDRSITTEMVKIWSDKVMQRKGYVYLAADKSWVPRSETEVEEKEGKISIIRRAQAHAGPEYVGEVVVVNEADRMTAIIEGAKVLATRGFDAMKSGSAVAAGSGKNVTQIKDVKK